jgi:hypothetical protein
MLGAERGAWRVHLRWKAEAAVRSNAPYKGYSPIAVSVYYYRMQETLMKSMNLDPLTPSFELP